VCAKLGYCPQVPPGSNLFPVTVGLVVAVADEVDSATATGETVDSRVIAGGREARLINSP
jgi:hypothetical protein